MIVTITDDDDDDGDDNNDCPIMITIVPPCYALSLCCLVLWNINTALIYGNKC